MNSPEPRRHSVENGVLLSASVSAAKKFASCPASYHFKYVQHKEEPQGAGAELGTALHGENERYLGGCGPVLSEIPRTGLHLLPIPGSDLGLEVEFGAESGFNLELGGVLFKGFIDLVNPRRVASDGLLELTDYKFKGDPKKYGTTPARLMDPTDEDGIQMVGYAMAAYNAVKAGHFPGTRTIRLRHIHYKTKQTKENPVPAVEIFVDVALEDVPALWAKVAPLIQGMKAVARATDVAQVEGNKRACFKYGGCAFRTECPHFHSTKPADKAFRIGELLLKPSSRPSPTVPTAGPQPGAKHMGMLSRIQQPKAVAAPPIPPALQAPTKPSLIVDESQVPDAELRANPNVGKPVASVLPPDAPKSDPAKASMPATPAVAPVTAQAPTQAIAPTEPIDGGSAPAKRTRRTKAEMEAARAVGPVEQVIELPPGTVTLSKSIQATEAVKILGVPAEGFSIYIGCSPRKAKATSLVPYVDGLEALALEGFRTQLKLEIDDIRFATGSEVGFGKWKAVLAALAKDAPPAPGAYTVLATGLDERVDAVVAALENLAGEVVTR